MLIHDIVDSRLPDVKPLDWEITVIEPIEETIRLFELTITQKTTLSTKRGSVHYHLKKGKEKGVLEVTYWPQKHQLWVEIHNNRSAEWNRNVIGPFTEKLAGLFGGTVQIKSEME